MLNERLLIKGVKNMKEKKYLHFKYKNKSNNITLNVNKTLLTWCIPLSVDNKLWKAVSDESIEQLKNQGDERINSVFNMRSEPTYINIRLLDVNGDCIVEVGETVIYQKKDNGDAQIRVNLSKISFELQKIFWFTTMTTIMNNNVVNDDKLKFESDIFKEKVKIIPVVDPLNEKHSGICIKPLTVVSSDMLCSGVKEKEVNYLLKMIQDIMNSNTYRLVKNQNKSEKHTNKIINAGQWKDASEFHGIDTAMINSIYYLASEPRDGEPANLYIGEAQESGGRLITKKIDGKTYIGHSERKTDFSIYKFTRYRIDQISTLDAMHNAQDALIGAFNMSDCEVFQNGFKLTNKAFNKAHSEANRIRKKK